MTEQEQTFADLDKYYNEEMVKYKEQLDKKLITEKEYQEALIALRANYTKDTNQIESKRYQKELSDYSNFASSMSSLASSWEHENEGRRKAAFRAAKAFSIASASLEMGGAISKALNDWSGGTTAGRFALAAGVLSSFSSLISSIQSTDYQGARAQGGQFNSGTYLVGEKGPELVRFGGSGRIASNEQTKALMSNGSAPSVTIINQTTGKIDKTESQFDEGRLVITIQEVMERETMSPNSKFNKAFNRTRKTQRVLV
jgi:hypothetical protein